MCQPRFCLSLYVGWLACACLLPSCARESNRGLVPTPPTRTTSSDYDFSKVDHAIEEAIERGDIPGGVILIGTSQQVLHRGAFGRRALEPEPVPMTVDTVFDLASLTKTIATATSIMLLVEQGRIELTDPVVKFLPAFGAHGKAHITIEQLLIHASGLTPGNPVADYDSGKEAAYATIDQLHLNQPPGEVFIYSDVGYIVLGRIVEAVSGMTLNAFVQEKILDPLAMTSAGFLPDANVRDRCATTEQRKGRWMRGKVHDPKAYRLGGVAGHAGLFATADDVGRYAQMILRDGRIEDGSFLMGSTVWEMTRPRPSGRQGVLRALGWDVSSSYSSARGNGFELGRSFGHTGFTGTSLWIAPDQDCYVILLTNRVHPNGKGKVVGLRREVATLVDQAIGGLRPVPLANVAKVVGLPAEELERDRVELGIDVLAKRKFDVLRHRRVGLIANHTSRNGKRNSTASVLAAAEGVSLVQLFSPEHGLRGRADALVGDSVDSETGLPVLSLYNASKRPTGEMLVGIDTLVFDIQDIGIRFYTYISTMLMAMEAAAEHDVRFVVLDRPNPLSGSRMFGPMADEGRSSFTCPHPLPMVHGRTVGELAMMFNRQRAIGVDLVVVKMAGWRRTMWWDQTGIAWVNPSPNIRNLTEAVLYPAIGVWERTNLSVGRGTDTPFEHFGAPWIDADRLTETLTEAKLAGVNFTPTRFTPSGGVYVNELCHGVRLTLTDRDAFDPIATAVTIAVSLHELFGQAFQMENLDCLLVHKGTAKAISEGKPPTEILSAMTSAIAGYQQALSQYTLYPD